MWFADPQMNAFRPSSFAGVVTVVSFVLTTALTLASMFGTHSEMPGVFKIIAVVLVVLSGYLTRYISAEYRDKGEVSMAYTFVLHSALLSLLFFGARLGTQK